MSLDTLTEIYATPEEICFELEDHTILIRGDNLEFVKITSPCEEVETIYPSS